VFDGLKSFGSGMPEEVSNCSRRSLRAAADASVFVLIKYLFRALRGLCMYFAFFAVRQSSLNRKGREEGAKVAKVLKPIVVAFEVARSLAHGG
jgi:hypothetical protein